VDLELAAVNEERNFTQSPIPQGHKPDLRPDFHLSYYSHHRFPVQTLKCSVLDCRTGFSDSVQQVLNEWQRLRRNQLVLLLKLGICAAVPSGPSHLRRLHIQQRLAGNGFFKPDEHRLVVCLTKLGCFYFEPGNHYVLLWNIR